MSRLLNIGVARPLLSATLIAGIVLCPRSVLGEWKHLLTEDGIEVSEQEVPGRSLPIFRGTGVVDASIYEILAVITDNERHTEWMHNCIEARVLRRESETVTYSYNRTDAPWPVSDRDVIVRSERIIVEPGRTVEMRFKSVDGEGLMDPVRGTVRMRQLEGHYKLQVLDPGRTQVEYQVNADPGGSLPAFLAKSTTRELPLRTLLNLRRQVGETRGEYDEFLDRWDPARR